MTMAQLYKRVQTLRLRLLRIIAASCQRKGCYQNCQDRDPGQRSLLSHRVILHIF